jgi:hypothetical protein
VGAVSKRREATAFRRRSYPLKRAACVAGDNLPLLSQTEPIIPSWADLK